MQAYASVAGSGFFPSSSDKPVVPGFLLPVLVPFGLRGSSLPLATILVALSPDPKIPFLADVARARPMGARPQSRVVPFVDRFGGAHSVASVAEPRACTSVVWRDRLVASGRAFCQAAGLRPITRKMGVFSGR